MQIIYFHGIPGSARELELFGPALQPIADRMHVVERGGIAASAKPEDYVATLAMALVEQFPEQQLHLVGFSLGGSLALRIAPFLGERVARIDCISSAAPLRGDGDFSAMAGGALFRMARDRPALFRAVSLLQGFAARHFPARLARVILADTAGQDAALAAQPHFLAGMEAVLQDSFARGLAAYRKEMKLYAQDWANELISVTPAVHLWHGSDDNWAPLSMAREMSAKVQNCERVRVFDGLSHYSTLERALRELTSEIAT